MIARFAGASLGLLAFTVTAVAGLYVKNPVSVTLSRSILALFVFCSIGVVLGAAAQKIVSEHHAKRKAEIKKQYRGQADGGDDNASPPATDTTEALSGSGGG